MEVLKIGHFEILAAFKNIFGGIEITKYVSTISYIHYITFVIQENNSKYILTKNAHAMQNSITFHLILRLENVRKSFGIFFKKIISYVD